MNGVSLAFGRQLPMASSVTRPTSPAIKFGRREYDDEQGDWFEGAGEEEGSYGADDSEYTASRKPFKTAGLLIAAAIALGGGAGVVKSAFPEIWAEVTGPFSHSSSAQPGDSATPSSGETKAPQPSDSSTSKSPSDGVEGSLQPSFPGGSGESAAPPFDGGETAPASPTTSPTLSAAQKAHNLQIKVFDYLIGDTEVYLHSIEKDDHYGVVTIGYLNDIIRGADFAKEKNYLDKPNDPEGNKEVLRGIRDNLPSLSALDGQASDKLSRAELKAIRAKLAKSDTTTLHDLIGKSKMV